MEFIPKIPLTVIKRWQTFKVQEFRKYSQYISYLHPYTLGSYVGLLRFTRCFGVMEVFSTENGKF